MLPVPKHLHTRLLYANPCCALVTANAPAAAGGEGGFNAMCISWLTPIDNHGLVMLSLNAARHSAGNVLRERQFTLSVLTEAQRGDALACGGSHGTGVAGGKLAALGLPLVALGGAPWEAAAGGAAAGGGSSAGLPVLAASPAHLHCRLLSLLAPSEAQGGGDGGGGGGAPTLQGHLALLCRVEGAWVKEAYWGKHKLLTPAPGLPRLLCFLGSGVFAAMQELEGGGGGGGGKRAAAGEAPARA